MRNVLLGVIGSVLLMAACAAPAGSSSRPNSATAMQASQQAPRKDPHDWVTDPTIGSDPPARDSAAKSICQLQCGAGTHCDASGFVERCVPDEEKKQ
jgi:hypothetical protein